LPVIPTLARPVMITLLLLGLVGCGANRARPAHASAGDAPMPTGAGTRRALVLVDDDGPQAKRSAPAPDDALSTPRIMKKVLGSERSGL
jgi:hypothetical protein